MTLSGLGRPPSNTMRARGAVVRGMGHRRATGASSYEQVADGAAGTHKLIHGWCVVTIDFYWHMIVAENFYG